MNKILLIDDNAKMRLFLDNYFGQDFETVVVERPSQAIELYDKGFIPDIIVADYYAKDQKEAISLNTLTRQPNWNLVPLFILTDDDKSDQRIQAMNYGASDTMSKPFNPKELKMRLNNLVTTAERVKSVRRAA